MRYVIIVATRPDDQRSLISGAWPNLIGKSAQWTKQYKLLDTLGEGVWGLALPRGTSVFSHIVGSCEALLVPYRVLFFAEEPAKYCHPPYS